jgi:predicted aconitase with swiveling domain
MWYLVNSMLLTGSTLVAILVAKHENIWYILITRCIFAHIAQKTMKKTQIKNMNRSREYEIQLRLILKQDYLYV